jgi:hypothetical protein
VKGLPDPLEDKLDWSLKNIKKLLRKAYAVVGTQTSGESTMPDVKVFEWVASNMTSKAGGDW